MKTIIQYYVNGKHVSETAYYDRMKECADKSLEFVTRSRLDKYAIRGMNGLKRLITTKTMELCCPEIPEPDLAESLAAL